ncbi:MAG: AAA family ATPase [Sulfurimonas sp.]|uniref:ATP-dependent DNA helicase n=1 Tax=Sulfurimonas sp. TaxID=2022749 RepID=UPI00260D9C73|nr:AAA family ATPase [Sulfurimonas sp.]MCW8895753.1 AAA family ATPase [Sulfurimonas sp.]MCW8953438.1 AAA family ATPase [Sulfurimonas sp.]MCW9067046.1 AAA family ATPase [Sulfurimonas sp.]
MNYLNVILEKLRDKQNIFLTGGAGVGKTTITKDIIRSYEEEAKKVAKLASTGMAATLINGQTLHSFLDLGIAGNLKELELNSKLEISKKTKKLLSAIDLIVIDEISMVSDTLLDMIRLRLIQAEFAGSLLVVGDFLQLPPVVRGYGEVRFAFESASWKKFEFETVELTHIYRTDDKDFIKLLSHVRDGFVDESVHNNLNEFIKPLPEDLSEFTFLFGKNNSASMHNKNQLEFIDSELFVKEAQIIKHVKSTKDLEIERFMGDARIEKNLELKIGVPVLFTRNSWNYFNGERGVVVNVDSSFVYVQKSDGLVVKLEAIAQSKSMWKEKSVGGKKEIVEESVFSVYQYPIKLAYAITIHKSQGMSIEDLIIETNEIFAPSQFYVAISRSSNPKRLNLIAPRRQWREIVFVNNKALEFVKVDKSC